MKKVLVTSVFTAFCVTSTNITDRFYSYGYAEPDVVEAPK